MGILIGLIKEQTLSKAKSIIGKEVVSSHSLTRMGGWLFIFIV